MSILCVELTLANVFNALKNDDPKALEKELKPLELVNSRCEHGGTDDVDIILLAALFKAKKCLKKLVDGEETGYKLNEPDRHQNLTSLQKAVIKGQHETIPLLLKHGANPNLDDERYYDETALTLACKHNQVKCAEELIRGGRVDVNIANKDGDTPLHVAAEHGHQQCAALLLRHRGIDIEKKNSLGQSALIAAAASSSSSVVTLLLDAGAVVDAQGTDGNTALIEAAGMEDEVPSAELVSKLLDAGADLNLVGGGGDTALIQAAWVFNHKRLKVLLDAKADITKRNNNGETALFRLVRQEIKAEEMDAAVKCVKLLLDNGFNVNDRDGGYTVLMIATSRGHRDIVEELLTRADIEVDAVDDAGKTALMHGVDAACKKGPLAIDCVAQLLTQGKAKLHLRDNNGMTALAHAQEKNGLQPVILILEAMENINKKRKRRV